VLADAFRKREVSLFRENFKAVVVQERLLQVRQEKAQIIELQGLAADAAGTRSIDAQGKKHALTTALMNWDA